MRLIFILIAICLNALFSFGQKSLPLDIKVTDLSETQIQLDNILKGDKPIIICFWATWCKPCMNELEGLSEISAKWENKVRVIAISVDDSRSSSKVKSLVAAKKWPFEVYIDQNQELKRALNISGIPFALVLSKSGKIVYKHTGYSPGGEDDLVAKALELGNE